MDLGLEVSQGGHVGVPEYLLLQRSRAHKVKLSLKQRIDIPIPFGHIISKGNRFLLSNQIRIGRIFLGLLLLHNLLDLGMDFNLDFGHSDHFLALSKAEIELIDLPHDIAEGVLIRGGLLLEVVPVEAEHRHHELVDVLVGHIQGIGLVLEVQVDNLDHLGDLERVDALVQVEIILLDQQNIASREHLLSPLKLDLDLVLLVLLQDDKPDVEVGGEGCHIG